MDLEPGMTKQGVRDLNSLYPKKKKPRATDEQRGEGAAPIPEQPVAAAAVAALIAPTPR